MERIRVEHTFNCTEDTYWTKVFFDDEYNRRLFLDALSFEKFSVASLTDTATGKRRVVDAVPKLDDLPGPLKKVIGDGIGYRETGEFDAARKRVKTTVVTSKLSDKIQIEGELWTEALGDRCKRVFECRVTAKIFGIGGMIEKRVCQDMEQSYATAAKFTNEFIAEKGL